MSHIFDVELLGRQSRIWMDGQALLGVRDIKIHQPLNGSPIVTVEFVAQKVTTRDKDEKTVALG